ncbi:hypothetical protein Nmel_011314 [Mimus melanotis]
MKAQPAAASVLCLCLVLAACAASAAGGLGKGQTITLSSGFPQLLSPLGAGPVPLARGGQRERSFGGLEVRGAVRGLRRGGSVLAEALLRGSLGEQPLGAPVPVPAQPLPGSWQARNGPSLRPRLPLPFVTAPHLALGLPRLFV